MTDPIADMLTRIRTALNARKERVLIPYSKFKEAVLRTIEAEGYIKGFEVVGEGIQKQLVAELKYMGPNEPVISGLSKISRLGRRVYKSSEALKSISGSLGAVIVSTSKGVMTQSQANQSGLGGEVLCRIW